MKYVFIVNPIAGNDNKAKIFSRIKSTFRLIDDEMIVEPTHAQGEAKLIAQKYAAQYGSDCVIVSCGGDGTVHELQTALQTRIHLCFFYLSVQAMTLQKKFTVLKKLMLKM